MPRGALLNNFPLFPLTFRVVLLAWLQVYDCYYHAFNTLRNFPPVRTQGDNEHFSQVLRRLVDEHGEHQPAS